MAKTLAKQLTWMEVYQEFAEEAKQRSARTAEFYDVQGRPFFEWLDGVERVNGHNGTPKTTRQLVGKDGEPVAAVPTTLTENGVLCTGLTRKRIVQFVNLIDAAHKAKSAGVGLKERSKNATWRCIRAVFYWSTGHPNGKVSDNNQHPLPKSVYWKIEPLNRPPDDEPHRVKEPGDWRLIRKAIRESGEPVRDLAFVTLALSAGLRRSELVSLRWSDITEWDAETRTAKVSVRAGKGLKDRDVVLGDHNFPAYTALLVQRAQLCKWMGMRPADIDAELFVFPIISKKADKRWAAWRKAGEQPDKRPKQGFLTHLAEHSASTIFVRLSKASGVDVTCHSCRHTCARQWAADGLTASTIQVLLGHSRLETTERYLRTTKREAQDSLRNLYAKTGSKTRQQTATASGW